MSTTVSEIYRFIQGSTQPVSVSEIAEALSIPANAKQGVEKLVQDLTTKGKVFSWPNGRVWSSWKEDEDDFYLHKARELIRDTPLWKSALAEKLMALVPNASKKICDGVFDQLKAQPDVHLWPRHRDLKGDAICLKPVDLKFYLGEAKSGFTEGCRKLVKAGVPAADLVNYVCEEAMPALAASTPGTSAPQSVTGALEPESESDHDYQRDVTEHLVFAWQDAKGKEARQQLERVMFNIGLRRLGEPNGTVSFNGMEHESQDRLFPGDKAAVVEPGWLLLRGPKKKVLAKAKVKSLNAS